MSYDVSLDPTLSSLSKTSKENCSVHLENVDCDVLDLSDFENIEILTVKGRVRKLILPRKVLCVECRDCGIEEIVPNDIIEDLHIPGNSIKHIALPPSLQTVILNNNNLQSLTSMSEDGESMPRLQALYMRNTPLKEFVLKLNPDVFEEFMVGESSSNLRIKYLDCIVSDQCHFPLMCNTDCIDVCSGSKSSKYSEAFKARLYAKMEKGETFIDMKSILRGLVEEGFDPRTYGDPSFHISQLGEVPI